jgi:hypothetical protein
MNKLENKTDKLFSEKLKEHTVQPREQAWLKLEAKLKQKEKKVVPFWQRLGIAASLALLLLAGGIAFFYKPEVTNGIQVATNQPILPMSKTDNIQKEALFAEVTNLESKTQKPKEFKQRLKSKQQNINTLPVQDFAQVITVKNDNKIENNIDPNSIGNLDIKESVAIVNINETKIDEAKANKLKPSEDLTVVVTLANYTTDNELKAENQEKKKPKFISRLFSQIMNAKNGEKVEWNEIGFKPAKIFARAEGKLKSTGEDINNTYNTTKNKTIL